LAEVFLSYSRTDRPIAQAVALELQRLGVDVWWDHDLLGGDDFRQRIAEILARAGATVVIWSRRSVESQWVVGEASAARENKTLLPVNIDRSDPPLDFRAVHSIDFADWVPGDQLPEQLVKALTERLGREVSYAAAPVQTGGLGRLTRRATQAWYMDVESMLFYFIGQAFACSLTNIPVAVYGSRIPTWAPFLLAAVNGTIVAAIHMRPALETRRLGIAAPLFCLAALVSLPAYLGTSWLLQHTSSEVFLTIVGFWMLAYMMATDIARRASGRG
jgi:hypothetical protein